jgi:predicted regulator of Ras-like GTPase activity (Roadblock/LC7/MglB family)
MSHDDDLRLLRAFEPVVRLTQGEFFLPVGVEDYVTNAALWFTGPDDVPVMLAEPGSLDLDSLAAHGATVTGAGQSISGITVPTSRWRRLRGRRTKKPKFRGSSRLAQVGLLGRTIDTLSRFSLLLRGAVPGGSAGLSLDLQTEHLHPERPMYHAHVTRDGGWIVCQYWFFYSFNNWRSAFSGVNEHESDWEQVTVFLDGTGALDDDGLPLPRWVVFSAHDETGDDLRRRWDDPDLMLVDGRHPVVFAGAGSHSGAYLAGDYLITVAPPSLGGVVPLARRVAKVLTPWTRAAQGEGLGIPYVDYARGDGPAVGPGEALTWTPVVIDDDTPWVRDYRGLWGHDTRDRLGGERGPAGPRYDRDGSVRQSWGDPVGWAGLAKVAPNPELELALVGRRIQQIDLELQTLSEQVSEAQSSMVTHAAGLDPAAASVRALAPEETARIAARMMSIRLADERERLVRTQRDGVATADPHAHLNHRRTPIGANERGRSRFLAGWAIVSTPLVLWLISVLFRPDIFGRGEIAIGALVLVLSVEAFARGYFLAFIWRLLLLLVALNFALLFFQHWQVVISVTMAIVALIVLFVNIKDARGR